jgi:hypothetical protein
MNQPNPFKKAERTQIPLKIALTGPSGSVKTMGACLIAQGIAEALGGRFALIDTENKSASLYSDRFDFDTIQLDPPYTIDKYMAAIDAAVANGYPVVVADSISHAWAGEGGLLQKKEQLDSRGGKQNQYANWAPITKEQETFMAKILHSDIHIICTIRSKQDYALVEKNGKKEVEKLGLAPVQRDGIEYEFTVVFDGAMDHTVKASKDRTGIFKDRIFVITKDLGKELITWLKSAKPVDPPKKEIEKARGVIDDALYEIDHAETIDALRGVIEKINTCTWTDEEKSHIATKKEARKLALKEVA